MLEPRKNISTEEMNKAHNAGYHVTIIINGEYYHYIPGTNQKQKTGNKPEV